MRDFAARIYEQRKRAYSRLQRLAENTRLVLPNWTDIDYRTDVRELRNVRGTSFDRKFLSLVAGTTHDRFYKFELESGALRTAPAVEKFARDQLQVLQRNAAKARSLLQHVGTR